jgi:hypothetical protein
LNLLVWYSKYGDVEDNVTMPRNTPLAKKVIPPSYSFDFTIKRADHSIRINVDPGFELPSGESPLSGPGPGRTLPYKDTPSKVRVMPTVFDGGLELDISPHLSSKNINWDLLTEFPAKVALILGPVMTLPMLWIDPALNWYESQRTDYS